MDILIYSKTLTGGRFVTRLKNSTGRKAEEWIVEQNRSEKKYPPHIEYEYYYKEEKSEEANMKTMAKQFEENRKEVSLYVSDMNARNVAKNILGDQITALIISAYATGFAHGSDEKEMTTDKWAAIVQEKWQGNDFIREMLAEIQHDFHALGGVK